MHSIKVSPVACDLPARSLPPLAGWRGEEQGCRRPTRTLLHDFFLTHVLNVHCAVHDELGGGAVVVQLEFFTLVTLDLQRKACGTDAVGFRSNPHRDRTESMTRSSPCTPGISTPGVLGLRALGSLSKATWRKPAGAARTPRVQQNEV